MTTHHQTPPLTLISPTFQVEISRATGAVTRISHPDDPHAMNWVGNPVDTPWQPLGNGWGLGYLALHWPGGNLHRWQQPSCCEIRHGQARSLYHLPMAKIATTRTLLPEGRLEETFAITNTTDAPLDLWGVVLATPWNDNYPDAATCLTRRCHAHLWCGGNVAYACAMRMGTEAPHLGLVMTRGNITGYSIADRGMHLGGSNLRGTILLNHQGFTLAPGATHTISWLLFWHRGMDDFMAQAQQIPGFVGLDADTYTVPSGHAVRLRAAHPTVPGPLHLSGPADTHGLPAELDPQEDATLTIRPAALGDCVIAAETEAGQKTCLRLRVIPPLPELIRARVDFILDHQQVDAPGSPLDGAFLPYDNIIEKSFLNPRWADQNEGRERLGMGVLLALWARREPSPRLETALRRYHAFVRGRLQSADGTVHNGVGDATQRLYNYPWVAHFHLEMFHTFGDPRFLDDFVATLHAFYAHGGDHFYCIGLPLRDGLATLQANRRTTEAQRLLTLFRAHADQLVETGRHFPPHEVNFEQTIVAPAVWIPLEFHLATGEERYLAHAQAIMPLLEAFEGNQPDHRLNGIAIRHWDGFWFGRRRLWGDTFPHYWSSVSGYIYHLYAQATGDQRYPARARNTLINNLSLFTPDGRASCAYLYPDTINGEPGRLADELANDQDWALVYLLLAFPLFNRYLSVQSPIT